METMRVLVTGAGSGVGQGIIKALRASALPIHIISSDIHPLNAGLYLTDDALILPKVEEQGSLATIISTIKKSQVDVVMVGSEFDLEFFSKHKNYIEEKSGVLIATSDIKTIQIAGDKYLTAQFFKKHSLPYAESYRAENIQNTLKIAKKLSYPLILKPRKGTSSRHVHIVNNENELLRFLPSIPSPMIQKLIDKPAPALNNEYTCSIFKCRNGDILGPFVARRTLRAGHSWVVEVTPKTELNSMLRTIGDKMSISGSLNIQLILSKQGPIPFELNARFSGTTAVRAYFGFNEPEMFLKNYYLGEPLPLPQIREGTAFRYAEEIFLDGVTTCNLANPFPKGHIKQWF